MAGKPDRQIATRIPGPRATDVADRAADHLAGAALSPRALVVLILVQSLCAAFFLSDALADVIDVGPAAFRQWHLIVESIASLALFLAIGVEVRMLGLMVTRQRRMARAVTAAAGGLHDLVEAYFADWGLTASEKDVAWLSLKGLSIQEVAEIRGSAEGTVKAHLHAVYRKGNIAGRNALLALLVEDLMSGELVTEGEGRSDTKVPGADGDARASADGAAGP
jgi:DNA-binding CsgD family transcriptional regulator